MKPIEELLDEEVFRNVEISLLAVEQAKTSSPAPALEA